MFYSCILQVRLYVSGYDDALVTIHHRIEISWRIGFL